MQAHFRAPQLRLGLCGNLLLLASLTLVLPLGTLSTFQCPKGFIVIQRTALTDLYNTTGGHSWHLNPSNGTTAWLSNAPCKITVPENGTTKLVSLPPHCCWEGVTCCLGIPDNGSYAPCSQYQCNCTAVDTGAVTGLSLGRVGLTAPLGEIFNQSFIDAMGCSLRMVFMGGNNITGKLPADLEKFSDLRILSLGSNGITGTIPSNFSRLQMLEELELSNNQLTGTVPRNLCGELDRVSRLRDLILSNNLLNGELDVPGCDSLIYLDGQNNNFSGSLPSFSSYHQLHILRLGNNSFTGEVRVQSFDLRLLVVVDLSANKLTGVLPQIVGRNGGQLAMVRLHQNAFVGTIPGDLFALGTLSTLSLQDNQLNGTLPETIGSVRGLASVNLANNYLVGTLPASLEQLAISGATLDVSRTNLSCCGNVSSAVQGKGYENFDLSMPRLPPYLALSPDLTRPVFDNTGNFTSMRCPFITMSEEVANRTGNNQSTFISFSLDPEYYLYENCICINGFREVWNEPKSKPSMGRYLTCVKIESPWYRQYPWAVLLIVLGGLLVCAWLTYLMCFRRGKNAAIVQSFFNLRKRIQGEPIGGQVSIVVTDIEGYSDLMKQSPELMTRALNLHNAIIRKSRWNNFGYTLEQEGDSYALVFYEAHDAVIFCLQTQLALNRQTWPEGLFGMEPRDVGSRKRPQAPSLLNAISVMTNNLTQSLFGGRPTDDRCILLATPSTLKTNTISMDVNRPDSRHSSSATPNGRGEFSALANPSALSKGHSVLFNGLRVRMGISTGTLPPGNTSKGSAVMDMAKMVSDAANGGQIMMDEKTFKNVKERIEEFSAVDHNGMNFKKLNSIQPPWYACIRKKTVRDADDALLLDMGEYTYCPGCKRLPLFQLEATPNSETPGGGAGPGALPATPKGAAGRRGKAVGGEPIRLYQVVPPPLVGRAKVFGNKVTVKDEWYCSDSPYFDAPGTNEAPLGAVEGPLLLPAITMAFLIAENGKIFAARYRRDARRVNDVIAASIRACLRCVPGGYLCRMQDGDLKYMVAFSTPQAAVEWSLLLQDVLMYADWPESALKHWKEEYDDKGRLVFRGPRMKIGLCEGSPRSIIPDHIGRADYHGASINQAARYMDAAAHGGMIALEASLVVKVMDYWRTAAEGRTAAAAATATATAAATSSDTAPNSDAPTPPISEAGGSAIAAAAGGTALGTAAGSSSDGGAGQQRWVGGGGRDGSGGSGSGSGRGSGSGVGPAVAAAVTAAAQRCRMTAVREVEAEDCHQSTSMDQQVMKEATATASDGSGGGGAAAAEGHAEAEAADSPAGDGGAGKRVSGSGTWGRFEAIPVSELRPQARNSLRKKLLRPQAFKQLSGSSKTTEGAETGSPAAGRRTESLTVHSSAAAAATAASNSPATVHAVEQPGNSGTAGAARPVAEGVEDGSDSSAGGTAAAEAAVEPSLSDGGGGGDCVIVAAAAAPRSVPAAIRHFERLVADSGPSMTSLTNTDNAMRRHGSSLLVSTAPQMTGNDSASPPPPPPSGPVAAAPAVLQELSSPKPTGADDHRRRPPPLDPVGSPHISWDGSATHGRTSGKTAAVAAAEELERSTSPVRTSAVRLGNKANPTAASSAPQLSLLLDSGNSVGAAATAAIGTLMPTPEAAAVPALLAPTNPSPGGHSPPSPPLWLSPAGRHTASGTRTHVSFAGDNPVAAARAAGAAATKPGSASASSADAQHPEFAPHAFSTVAAGGLPPLPPNASASTAAAAAAGVSGGGGGSSSSTFTAGSAATRRVGGSSPGLLASWTAPMSSFASSAGAAAASAAIAAEAAMGSSASTGSATTAALPGAWSIRSPRPPSLSPLALPSERERDETLRAERAALEAARKVQVDGPADARYTAQLVAFRIGVFCFKGNPEPIQMAHVVLEHLSGRKFPTDAPKGKGAKVGDSSGILDECAASLPDLASIMRDRYMLSRPPNFHHLELTRSSPSTRRLRLHMGGSSMGSAAGGGHSSPSSPGRSNLGRSRSHAGTLRGPASISDGGAGGSGTSPPAVPLGAQRRASGVMQQLALQLASASRRWTGARDAGESPGGRGGGSGRDRGSALSVTADAAVAAAEGADNGASPGTSSAGAVVGITLAPEGGASLNTGSIPAEAVLPTGTSGSSTPLAAAAIPTVVQDSRPGPGRSPLRFVSNRDDGGSSTEHCSPSGAAVAASSPGGLTVGGGEAATWRGDKRV